MAAPMQPGAAGALEGMHVVEIAGPLGEWCGRLLANLGAEVIKVEPPGGAATREVGPFLNDAPDPEGSLYFWHNNTSKRSLTLDLTRPRGEALLQRLLARADVLLEALPHAPARALGLRDPSLGERLPRLVACSITPFGPDGPYADYLATDLISMALGGPMQSCGYDREDGDLPPVRPGPYHSFHTASHFAATGILAALVEREVSGRGQLIEVAAHDCLAVTVEFANTNWYYTQTVLRRQTGRHAGAVPTSRSQFPTADGRYVNLALPRDNAAWLALVAQLEQEGLTDGLDLEGLDDPVRRFAEAGRAYHVLELLCATRGAEELFHFGQSLGLTWAPVRAPEQWLDDPHARARDFIIEVEHPELGRAFPYPGAPFIAQATPWRIRRRAPLIGEDSDDVLLELGLNDDEIEELRRDGVV